MHREIWERAHGIIHAALQIDHREHGDVSGLDNRRSNLRVASVSQNIANQRLRRDNTSGYRGVSFNGKRGDWEAYIDYQRRRRRLGYFSNAEEAATAYNSAATRLFGEFARLNVIGAAA